LSFASAPFVLGFLPICLAGFYLIRDPEAAPRRHLWLLLVSLVFYSRSGPAASVILAASLTFNFLVGRWLLENRPTAPRRAVVGAAVAANVILLLAYKVAAAQSGGSVYLETDAVLIPLGLSFITFQQITFLLDCARRRVARPRLSDYVLFLTFFPQLIMGPIVHYRDLVPQFAGARAAERFRTQGLRDLAVGLSIFAVGLFKKVVLADYLAPIVDRVFDAAASGTALGALDAWTGSVAFQLQLFLDFSGYADMAIVLARMVQLDLPINYDDPLRATSRFDLWRRWHITFVEFMRTHVFRPLARSGWLPTWGAILVTALLSGLWHGASWPFLFWGLTQGMWLLCSHVWGGWRRSGFLRGLPTVTIAKIVLTFLGTTGMGVLFRATSLEAAARVYGAALHGSARTSLSWRDLVVLLAAATATWVLPQTSALFARHWAATEPRPLRLRTPQRSAPEWLQFNFNLRWGFATALLLSAAIPHLASVRRFIYFQF
jgi:alginate O-acetyltransferase complex protein AlgI